MVSLPDFNKAFQDGAVLSDGITVERRVIGDVIVSSGRLVACDPAFAEEPPFIVVLERGYYPVVLSIAVLKNDKRIACAMFQVTEEVPVSWKPAFREGDKPNSQPAYGVDSAQGSFMDAQTAMIWRQRADDQHFVDETTEQMQPGYGDTCSWGSILISPGLSAAIFSTGYGDGFYRSYWGYTADGEAACLVTDFGLLKPSVQS
jgi:hypothetical protein